MYLYFNEVSLFECYSDISTKLKAIIYVYYNSFPINLRRISPDYFDYKIHKLKIKFRMVRMVPHTESNHFVAKFRVT